MKVTVNCPHCSAPMELERPADTVEASCPACSNVMKIDPAVLALSDADSLKPVTTRKPVSGWIIAGYVLAVLGGWLGTAIGIGILVGGVGDKKDKKHGLAILIISVFSQALWRSALQ